ncbi:hypothetical protein NBRC116187_10340 [Halopseudomonas sabulinigri]|uniref:Uncharacterized protein n=1 Tax=Halopseudomonas sabulinigri TaxID=472181 RepID=A0ABP9ZMH1_9GAMM
MLADIAQRRRAEQCIAQRMQHHVSIGMRQQAETMGNPNASKGDEIPLGKAVNVIAMTNAHAAT